MKNGKFAKRGVSTKAFAMILAIVALVSVTVGGTLAWLTANSGPVENTFTTSDIGVNLEETTTEYKMVPGWDIAKDPKAWVTEGSEDAILFVKVVESDNFDNFMTYEMAEGWNALAGVDGVYYREVTTAQMGKENAFAILKDNKVTVSGDVTKEMMSGDNFTQPTLTFTAYAHQLYQSQGVKFEAAAAWANLNPTT